MSARIAVPLLLALAAPAPATPAPAIEPVQSFALDPGTTVVLVEDHRAALVTLRLDFAAGTFSPWMHANHAEEAFEIQLHDPRARLRARADRLAADLSVTVGERSSTLFAACRKDDLRDVLQLVREVLANREFDRAELKRRSKARKIGWSASIKDPDFVVGQTIARLVFRDDDPRRRPFEKPEALETDVERLAAVRDTLVRLPGRLIGWAGDLTRAEAEQFSRDLLPPVLDAVPDGVAPALPELLPPARDDRSAALPRLTQVYFALTSRSVPSDDPRYPAFLVANHVLGGHFYSRLYAALRHETGQTYGAYARYVPDVAPGPYQLYTFTRTENAAEAERTLRGVLATFHEQGITDEERRAAAGYLVGRMAFERQSPDQALTRSIWETRRGLRPGFVAALPEQADGLTLEAVNAFIRDYYDPARFTLVTVRPPGAD